MKNSIKKIGRGTLIFLVSLIFIPLRGCFFYGASEAYEEYGLSKESPPQAPIRKNFKYW